MLRWFQTPFLQGHPTTWRVPWTCRNAKRTACPAIGWLGKAGPKKKGGPKMGKAWEKGGKNGRKNRKTIFAISPMTHGFGFVWKWGMPQLWPVNRENDDNPLDFRVPFWQTNPFPRFWCFLTGSKNLGINFSHMSYFSGEGNSTVLDGDPDWSSMTCLCLLENSRAVGELCLGSPEGGECCWIFGCPERKLEDFNPSSLGEVCIQIDALIVMAFKNQ